MAARESASRWCQLVRPEVHVMSIGWGVVSLLYKIYVWLWYLHSHNIYFDVPLKRET